MTLTASRYTVGKNSFASSGSTLTMTPVYKKYTVTDKLRAVDSVLPAMFENRDLKNIKGYPWSGKDGDGKNWNSYYSGYLMSDYIDSDDWVWDNKTYYLKYLAQYYQNKNFVHRAEPGLGSETTLKDGIGVQYAVFPSFLCQEYHIGCLFTKVWTSAFEGWDELMKYSQHSRDLENYLLIYINDNRGAYLVPLASTDTSAQNPFFIPWNAKMIVTGTAQITDRRNAVMPLTNFQAKDDTAPAYELYIPLSVQIGK